MNAIINSDCTKHQQSNKFIKTFFENCFNNTTVDVVESCSSLTDLTCSVQKLSLVDISSQFSHNCNLTLDKSSFQDSTLPTETTERLVPECSVDFQTIIQPAILKQCYIMSFFWSIVITVVLI